VLKTIFLNRLKYCYKYGKSSIAKVKL